jgi:hypothetical protein
VSGTILHEIPEQGLAAPRRSYSLAVACVVVYAVVVLAMFFASLAQDAGHFQYPMDDPYIHLALAENLAHGHYGLNPGEPSSPSSSILWPLLLAPFARFAWAEYLPLGLNALFCGISAWMIGRAVDGWDWSRGALPRPPGNIASQTLGWLGRLAFAVALMLVANLAGLTLVGMEHGLQVMLAIACAAGVSEVFAGRAMPWWCLAAATIGPLVRYEDFALTAAVCLVLYGQRRVATALRLTGWSLVGPLLFSAFLLTRGLPALPASVLVKAKAYSAVSNAALSILHNLYGHIHDRTVLPEWRAQFLVVLVLVMAAVREREHVRRFVLAAACLAGALQLALGQFNWFHRYEVYALCFTTLIAARALMDTTKLPKVALLVCLLGLAAPYVDAIHTTPTATANVYEQQYQMHRFVADFYRGNVAVNDIGWVSYRRPAGVYILDLWGLASPEATRQVYKDAAWLDALTAEHHAGLAIVYPAIYDQGAPPDWTPLATMCITSPRIVVAHHCVVFYSTAVGDKARLTAEMAAFAQTVPARVRITLGRDVTDRIE